jgi:hypothetical protein
LLACFLIRWMARKPAGGRRRAALQHVLDISVGQLARRTETGQDLRCIDRQLRRDLRFERIVEMARDLAHDLIGVLAMESGQMFGQ